MNFIDVFSRFLELYHIVETQGCIHFQLKFCLSLKIPRVVPFLPSFCLDWLPSSVVCLPALVLLPSVVLALSIPLSLPVLLLSGLCPLSPSNDWLSRILDSLWEIRTFSRKDDGDFSGLSLSFDPRLDVDALCELPQPILNSFFKTRPDMKYLQKSIVSGIILASAIFYKVSLQ